MRIKSFLFCLLSLSCGIIHAQTIKIAEGDTLHSKPKKVNIYIDRSYSMQGFFKVSPNTNYDNVNIVHSLFSNMQTTFPKGIVYYGFDVECDNKPLANQNIGEIGSSKTFEADYNVYSSVIKSLLGKNNKNEISVLITDGVPSLTSSNTTRSNVALNDALGKEKEDIKNYMHKYILNNSSNRIVIYRYYPLFNGAYYSSDNKSFTGNYIWNGHRNLYAVVFAKENQLQYVDKLFFDKKITKALKVKKLSPSLYGNVIRVSNSMVEYKNNKANFFITLEMKYPHDANLLKQLVSVENTKGKKINTETKYVNGNKLILQFAIPEEEYAPEQTYKIIAENGFIKDSIDEFKKLNIELELNQAHEKDIFTNDASYHSKTFRLSYLVNPIISLQEDMEGFVINYTLSKNKKQWVSYLEPMFGVIPPRASMEEINNQLAPLWMFLFRWVSPILTALMIFYFFLSFKMGHITNPKKQKMIWWSGFIFVFTVVFSTTAGYVFSAYVGDHTPSIGYQLKHLIYDPIWALFLYVILSLILTRRTWCTACNTPIPF